MDENPLNIYSTQEAATILHRSPNTLRDWRYKGIGPDWVRLGYKSVGYRPEALEAFLTAQTD